MTKILYGSLIQQHSSSSACYTASILGMSTQRYHSSLNAEPSTYSSRWQYPPNLDDMAAVLKLSDRWICAEPKAFAVAEINRLNLTPFYGSVNPCRLLELSRLYRVDEWFRPAFEQLVSTPVHTLSLDNIRALGDRNYTALSRCQSTIQQLRLSISATPPPIIRHTASCTSTPSCESAWKAFWWNVFAKDYLLGPLSESEALEFVKNATPNHVTSECKARVVKNIWDRDIFCAEYRVTQSAVEALMRLQKDT